MLKLSVSAVLCGVSAAIVLAADIPNPKYEAALRRVDKKCSHLNADQVQSIRETAEKMHRDGATRNATKKACKKLVLEWPTGFKMCATAIVAVEYIPTMIPEPPPPPVVSNAVQGAIDRGRVEKTKWLKRYLDNSRTPFLDVDLTAGSVGVLSGTLTVAHVVNPESVVINIHYWNRRKSRYTYTEDYYNTKLVLLKGVSTAGLADKDPCQFKDSLFRYAGTEDINWGGTVHKLERIELTADEKTVIGFGKTKTP